MVSMEKKTHTPGFRITGNKGFHMSFPNGYTISVQFGPGNYCVHYDRRIGHEEEACGKEGSPNAETAFWGPDGKLLSESNEEFADTVQGYQDCEQVWERMKRIAELPDPRAALKSARGE